MNKNFVVVTGLSGAGKTTASKIFEDIGFYTVDNIPPLVIPKFVEVVFDFKAEIDKVAIIIDIRSFNGSELYDVIKMLKDKYGATILFLEASDDILLRRFKETRRKHPLGEDVVDAITMEKKILLNIRELTDLFIDTSNLNVHEFYSAIENYFKKMPFKSINIMLQSFGFKYGIPLESDIVLDIRFLKNPYFIDELKDLTGESKTVRDYVMSDDRTHIFLKKFVDLVDFLLPNFVNEGKKYITISIGCTGGRHRSVVVVKEIYKYLSKDVYKNILIKHRDIDR
jgi:UPF0042 nucleotide-binding protein